MNEKATSNLDLSLAAAVLATRLPEGTEHRILDIGTGKGRDADTFLRLGHYVTGIDLFAHEDWKEIEAHFRDRVSFQTGVFEDLRFEGGYTAVLDNGGLHQQHPDAYQSYLAKIRGLMMPGAVGVICVYTLRDEELREQIEKARLECIDLVRLKHATDDRYYLAAVVGKSNC